MTQNDNDRNLRDSFRSFDHSVAAPDHLRDKVYSAFDLDPASQSRLRSTISGRSFRVISGLAAAAAIVVMIGAGLLLLGDHFGNGTPTSTPAVYAGGPGTPEAGTPSAATDDVVVFGGSEAQDGSYPGTVPVTSTYTKLWSQDVARMINYSGFYGNIFYTEGSAETLDTPVALNAYDSATGRLLWQTTVLTAPLTIFSGGVVVLIPTAQSTSDRVTYQVSLLDLTSGTSKWISADSFSAIPNDASGIGWVGLAGNGIVLQPDPKTVVVLDGAHGAERWRYTSNGTTEINCLDQPCAIAPAFRGNTLYLADQFAQKLLALDVFTGQTLWSIDLQASTAAYAAAAGSEPDAIPIVAIHATASGPLVELHAIPPATGDIVYFTSYDAATGAVRWMRVASDFHYTTLSNTSLYIHLSSDDPEAAEGLQQIDLETGSLVASFADAKPELLSNALYLPSANVFLVGTRTLNTTVSLLQSIPGVSQIFGKPDSVARLKLIDPATLGILGTSEFRNCFVDGSISQDGKVVCTKADGSGFTVYGPKP